MYLIASAFKRSATAQQNAMATAHLIKAHQLHNPELCFGMYKGEREVSVKLTAFDSQCHAQRIARQIIHTFGQECVLLVLDSGAVMAVTATDGQWLGYAERATVPPAMAGVDSFTQFMDGTVMHVAVQDALYALAA